MKQKHSLMRICVVGLICFIISIVTCGKSTATECVVDRLVDGDTAICSGQRIRLSDIDAPEKKQHFGVESTRFLSNMINGKTITYNSNKRDQYGRVIARVYMNGEDISLIMVRHGYAWAYMTKDKSILKAQDCARENKQGLWGKDNPIPPWKYRKGVR